MDLSQIKSVVTLYSDKDVNKYLASGWELVVVHQWSNYGDSGSQFILGWTKTDEPVHPNLSPDYGDEEIIPDF